MTPEEVAKYRDKWVQGQIDELESLVGFILHRLDFTEASDEIARLLAFAEVAVREYPKTASTAEEQIEHLTYVMARRSTLRTVLAYMDMNYAQCRQCGNLTNPSTARFCTQCGAKMEG